MKKIFFVLFLLLFPLMAKAECTSEEIIRLKALASKITVTYDYEETKNGIVFSTTFHNVYKDLKIIDNRNLKSYTSRDEFGDVTIKNILFPGTYSISIRSKVKKCNNENITTKYYTIPYYNSYSKDPLCKGNESNIVCQKWTNTNSLSYEDFKEALKKKTDENNVSTQDEQKKSNILMELYIKYYYVFFGAIILISLILIITINRKDRFNFDT